MRKLYLNLLSLCLLTIANISMANSLTDAKEAYEKEDYLRVINVLEQAIQTEQPKSSDYYHLLGRAYGRQAALSSWYEAINFAKLTRENLEKAVELDPKNIAALRDLGKFYKKAPPFLGGGEKKAETIAKRLEALGEKMEEEDV